MAENENQVSAKSITVSVSEHLLDEWDKEVEKMEYSSRSEYIRQHVQAGRKEFAQLHPEESEASDSIKTWVLDAIPSESELDANDTAPMPEDVITGIIDPLREEIIQNIDRLESNGRINFKARHGGYVKDE